MAKKVTVLSENGVQFELTPTRILERDGLDVYRFVKKTSIRKALKAFAAGKTEGTAVVLQHANENDYSNYDVVVCRTSYGQTPDILPVHIGCISFVGKDAKKIANWAKKVVSKTGKKTVAKVRAAAAGRAKRA